MRGVVVGVRDSESTENKALFLGAALTMEKHNMYEWLESADPELYKNVPDCLYVQPREVRHTFASTNCCRD